MTENGVSRRFTNVETESVKNYANIWTTSDQQTYRCIYALLALGLTMIYGIIKLSNFAHGDIYMLETQAIG